MNIEAKVVISTRAVRKLRAGHVWVYRSELAREDTFAPGSVVEVADERGNFLGTALYSSASQIALRMISPGRVAGEEHLGRIVRERIREAFAYRQRVVSNSDAYRVVFSEADMLPGLIVDRYHDIVSLQALTQAMDQPKIKQVVVDAIQELLQPASIVERTEERIRELEQMPAAPSAPLRGQKTATLFTMNGVSFHYDALAGQKTGAFLDQRENYAVAAQYSRGEALDVFCYQGGFALHLARRCSRVTGVDSSLPALEAAERNAALNHVPEIEWIEGNAFDLLKDYAAAGQRYDTIVLDPPPFARNQRALETALRGYKELNLRALRMLRPGGTLVTCSCSYHVSEEDFLSTIKSAASDTHRTPRILERRGQAKDHPVVLTIPETGYLKCIIFNVSN